MIIEYQNILLPVDGSQQSIDAFKRGISEGKLRNSKVYCVHVLKEDSVDILVVQRESLLNSLEEYVNNEGVSLHKEIIYGDPRTQIADELVERWPIDLVVMGAIYH